MHRESTILLLLLPEVPSSPLDSSPFFPHSFSESSDVVYSIPFLLAMKNSFRLDSRVVYADFDLDSEVVFEHLVVEAN